MDYLLDTNACIALINGKPLPVRTRFQETLRSGAAILTSSIVLFELWYGVGRSDRVESNTKRLETFLAGPVGVLAFEEEDARAAGRVRAEMEATGRPIGAYDLLIAGQALRNQMTLVTSNAREFRRVRGLIWEDWASG